MDTGRPMGNRVGNRWIEDQWCEHDTFLGRTDLERYCHGLSVRSCMHSKYPWTSMTSFGSRSMYSFISFESYEIQDIRYLTSLIIMGTCWILAEHHGPTKNDNVTSVWEFGSHQAAKPRKSKTGGFWGWQQVPFWKCVCTKRASSLKKHR